MSDQRPVIEWRAPVNSAEVNRLHADAFEHRVYTDDEWPWADHLAERSMGWCTARSEGALVGFLNVVTDGFVHAWIQDVIVASDAQGSGIGRALVDEAVTRTRAAGCEWLHVDFDDDHADFYLRVCGFAPAQAGLIEL